MLFNHHNARGATVHDVDSRECLERVIELDAKNGWVKVGCNPARLTPQGEVLTRRIRFRSIYPIWAGQGVPVMFHCYGRLIGSEDFRVNRRSGEQ